MGTPQIKKPTARSAFLFCVSEKSRGIERTQACLNVEHTRAVGLCRADRVQREGTREPRRIVDREDAGQSVGIGVAFDGLDPEAADWIRETLGAGA